MPNPKPGPDFRNISVLARGTLLQAIQQRADASGLTLAKAVMAMVEDAVSAGATAPVATLVNLESVSSDDLIDELVGRLQQIGERDEAIARAEAAEARLKAVAGALGGTIN